MLMTGPTMLKISYSMASVTVGSNSPTYSEVEGFGLEVLAVELLVAVEALAVVLAAGVEVAA